MRPPPGGYGVESPGSLAQDEGKLAEAEKLLGQALTLSRRIHGDQHQDTAAVEANYGRILVRRGRPQVAVPILRQALATMQALQPGASRRILDTQGRLGEALAAAGEFRKAEPLLMTAYTGFKNTLHDVTTAQNLAGRVADLYQKSNQAHPGPRSAGIEKEWRARATPDANKIDR